MDKPRRGDSRLWLNELEHLAAKTGTRAFSPMAIWPASRHSGWTPTRMRLLATAVEEVLRS
jgi:hypothetical protein